MLWPSWSSDRIPWETPNSSAWRQLTCFCNCHKRQSLRSGLGVSNSNVKLTNLKLLSKWRSLLNKSWEGSATVSKLLGGATTVGDGLVRPSWMRWSMMLVVLSSWSSNRNCSHSRVSVRFVNQLNDSETMFLKVGVQGIEPFCVGLNHHRECMISGLSSSSGICTSKWVILAHAIPLNFLEEDNFLALSNSSRTALLLESKIQLYRLITIRFEGPMFAPRSVDNSNSATSWFNSIECMICRRKRAVQLQTNIPSWPMQVRRLDSLRSAEL